MRITVMITSCLSILFCKGVISSVNSVLKSQAASYDNTENVRKFFVHFNTALEKIEPWLVMVIARDDEDLQSAEPAFEFHPHVICVKIENCEYPEEFYRSDIVTIIFLDDLSNKTIDRNMKVLLPNTGKVLFVSDLHRAEKNDVILFSEEILRRNNKALFQFIHFNRGAIDIYFVDITKRCTVDIRLDMAWKAGTDLSKLKFWDETNFNFNGCSLLVGTFNLPPKIFVKEDANGSSIITGGSSGYMIEEIANQLNFKIIPKPPSVEGKRLKHFRTSGIIHDVSSGDVSFGIGGFRATNDLSGKLTYSNAYGTECLTWGVPRIVDEGVSNIIWAEFEWGVWIGIGLVFVTACLIEYFYENLVIGLLRYGERRRNVNLTSIILNVLAIYLGNPVIRTSIYISGRIMFIAFTFYAMVITTGYKTSIASILATQETSPAVTDTKAIIQANFTVGGSQYNLDILKDQINSSKYISKLIERFIIIEGEDAVNRLKSNENFVYLARRSFLMYVKKQTVEAGELITFDILKECVLRYNTVMMFNRYSPLVKFADKNILRIIESGFLNHWDGLFYVDDKILERKNLELSLRTQMRKKMFLIFIFFGYGIAISIFVFFLELLWPRIMRSIKKAKRRTRVQRAR